MLASKTIVKSLHTHALAAFHDSIQRALNLGSNLPKDSICLESFLEFLMQFLSYDNDIFNDATNWWHQKFTFKQFFRSTLTMLGHCVQKRKSWSTVYCMEIIKSKNDEIIGCILSHADVPRKFWIYSMKLKNWRPRSPGIVMVTRPRKCAVETNNSKKSVN